MTTLEDNDLYDAKHYAVKLRKETDNTLKTNIMQFIVCAAIKIPHPEKDIILCGPRHGECLNLAVRLKIFTEDTKELEKNSILGFVDQDNNFYTREEAWVIADHMGEIRRPLGWEKDFSHRRTPNVGDVRPLFSENLY